MAERDAKVVAPKDFDNNPGEEKRWAFSTEEAPKVEEPQSSNKAGLRVLKDKCLISERIAQGIKWEGGAGN